MPNIKDFEDVIAVADGEKNQFRATTTGGVQLKGLGGRLETWATSKQKDSDRQMMRDFRSALDEAYGPEAAKLAWEKAGLEERLRDGRPLSVRTASLAIQEAKSVAIMQENVKYENAYRQKDEEATKWDPKPTASKVEGSGLRLVSQDQGEFRVHNWNSRNDPDHPPSVVLELDELVDKEVKAIKQDRQQRVLAGEKLEPMSDRLIYLQAKLNLTERMVSEACKPENLKEGGPGANVFLGPDMFFSPSDGPSMKGFDFKTTSGACTEEEMKQITRGLQEISARHPEVTLMPGTIIWNKPSSVVPKVGGLPRPSDLTFNTAPVFSKGDLTHVTYKKTDGGDADFCAYGINGDDPKAYTAPSQKNGFKARLQVFPHDNNMASNLGTEGMAQVQPVLDELNKQVDPKSLGRKWEDGLRKGGADARSPYNHLFVVEGKVMAMEICRDHGSRYAQKEYLQNRNATDGVMTLAKQQAGPIGGVNLHVLLSASSTMMRSNNICCVGGTAAQNDVTGGLSRNAIVKSRVDENTLDITPWKDAFYNKPATLKAATIPPKGLTVPDVVPETPKVDNSKVDNPSITEKPPTVERRPSVRDLIKPGTVSSLKEKMGLDQSQPSTKVSDSPSSKPKPNTVGAKTGLDKTSTSAKTLQKTGPRVNQ